MRHGNGVNEVNVSLISKISRYQHYHVWLLISTSEALSSVM